MRRTQYAQSNIETISARLLFNPQLIGVYVTYTAARYFVVGGHHVTMVPAAINVWPYIGGAVCRQDQRVRSDPTDGGPGALHTPHDSKEFSCTSWWHMGPNAVALLG